MNQSAIFYGVGVGPGDPELLTLKAARVLKSCPVLAVPKTRSGRSLALEIVQGALDISQKVIVPIPFSMTRDPNELELEHARAADLIRPYLNQGQNVAILTLGDVSVYSTAQYILDRLHSEGWPVQVVAGVPSFCAVAATLGESLTSMEQPLHIFPAGVTQIEQALDLPGTKVLMKAGKSLPHVVQKLRQSTAVRHGSLVMNCGLENEVICPTLNDYQDEEGYFATIIVK